MLLKVEEGSRLSGFASSWNPKELEIERFLLPETGGEPILREDVFKEQLLLVSNQVTTPNKKRADILALDRSGNAVIIELKRDQGSLGVETQALQYLSEFSGYQGQRFVEMFSRHRGGLEDDIRSFVGDEVEIEDLNRQSRIFLLARSFDPALFSLGHWLASHDVPIRCIEYTPIEIKGERFLDFSVAFDQGPRELFPLSFGGRAREPEVFWFNIGRSYDEWWQLLKSHGKITTGFENQPGDRGSQLLQGFVRDDRIIAYATGHGAVGYGVIEDPSSYELVDPGTAKDFLDGEHLHHLSINWRCTAEHLEDAIPAGEIRDRFDIFHPMSTSVRMDVDKARRLMDELNRRFGAPDTHDA